MFKKVFSKRNKVLLSEMIRTDFKLRYQGSVLGYLWSLLRPLLLFAILFVVFTRFLQIGRGVPNYALSLLLGIVLWSFFVEATTSAMKSVVGRGGLIRKINIPRYLIPVSVVASAFINLALNLAVVFIFVLFASDTPLSLGTLIVFPLIIIELVIFSLAVGFLLAALFVKYRDVEHIWEVTKQGLFYLIPIIYPLTLIPYESVRKILLLNPLSQIIQDARSVVTYGGTATISDLFDSPWAVLIPLSIVAMTVYVSVIYFRKRSKYFAEDI